MIGKEEFEALLDTFCRQKVSYQEVVSETVQLFYRYFGLGFLVGVMFAVIVISLY